MSMAATLALACGGCSLSKPYPAKELFAIDAGAPAAAASPASGSALRVLPARVVSPFDELEFHSLIGPAQFQKDYYANFVAKPDSLITSLLIEWLSKTGLYESVVDGSSPVRTERSLQCIVTALYCDKTNPEAPKAVVAARFFLIDDSSVEARVLFTRDYREAQPMPEGRGALALGWSQVMRTILEKLSSDLRSAQ
jgi:hypothetical protein